MKKITLLCIFSAGFYCANAQSVGINTDGSAPHTSAMLDIKSTSKGLLLPRVALTGTTDATTVASPATSLIVYNTQSAGSGNIAVVPGFYYWSGAGWAKLSEADNTGSTAWLLSGNAGTNPAAHFIGTTDNAPLQFRVNNLPAGKIDITGANTFFGYQSGKSITTGAGNTGIGPNALGALTAGTDNIAIGESALATATASFENVAMGKSALMFTTSGFRNVAVGNLALRSNTVGGENTAVGRSALYNNTNGNQNTGIGFLALSTNQGGNSNTAVGGNSMLNNTSGSNNTALGRSALLSNISGSLNTAVGGNALYNNNSGSNNTGIGFNANTQPGSVYNNATAIGSNALAQCSNCMVLGSVNGVNNATSDVTVGIGTNTPSATYKLDVTGDIRCTALFQTSDRRLKKNIQPMTGVAEKIALLNSYTYQWNHTTGGETEIGLLAQEVQQVFPQLVKTDENGRLAVNYSALVPVLLQAVKELQAAISELKTTQHQ